MALGTLFLVFIYMTVISILGIALLWLAKNSKVKTVCFYFLTIFSMVLAYLAASAMPTNFLTQQLICWIVGFVGVAGVLIKYVGRFPRAELLAKVLVTISVIGGLYNLFFF